MIRKLFNQGALFFESIHEKSIEILDILKSFPKLANAMKREYFFLYFLVTSHILRYELIEIHTGNKIIPVIDHNLNTEGGALSNVSG